MAQKLSFSAAVVCHKGCERPNNEDSFFFNGDYMPLKEMDKGACIAESFQALPQLYAVCYGMGGIQRGERASFLAVRRLAALLNDAPRRGMKDAIERYACETSDLICHDARKSRAENEGTTLAMLAFLKDAAYVANVGDSRVYRLRGRALERLTQDHSLINEQRMAGALQITDEQARKHRRGNVITRFLGMHADARPQGELAYQGRHTMAAGDRYLICSDGIWDLMSNVQIADVLCGTKDALSAARALVACALEMGGKDNATALVIDLA